MWKRAIIVALLFVLSGISVQAESWTVDKAHSSIGFSVRHMVISKVKGNFTDFSGTINFDGTDLSKGSADVTVQMTSINTHDEKRDGHLRSEDFFAVEKFSTMTFKSSKVIAGKDGKFQLVGMLTIKDVAKEVTFECEFNGSLIDPWGNERAGFSAETTIDRQAFNISFSKIMETGGLMVGNDVTITLDFEAIKSN